MLRRVDGWTCSLVILAVILAPGVVASADDYATSLIGYVEGSNAVAGYNDPNAALGVPSRITGGWPSGDVDVTVFNAPWQTDQIVSLGAGGSLIVGFDHPVMNAPSNPYGIDLLIFGNTYCIDSSYPNGIANGIQEEAGRIQVSQDGSTWYEIPNVFADTGLPTQGYADTSGPYGADGTVVSSFTNPVDPTFDLTGLTYAEILAGYNGSGGGVGVDLGTAVDDFGQPVSLDWIQYVKVSQDANDTWSTEIDAFADVVPEPATMGMLAVGFLGLLRRFRR